MTDNSSDLINQLTQNFTSFKKELEDKKLLELNSEEVLKLQKIAQKVETVEKFKQEISDEIMTHIRKILPADDVLKNLSAVLTTLHDLQSQVQVIDGRHVDHVTELNEAIKHLHRSTRKLIDTHHADRTEMVDYALAGAGAYVVSGAHSDTYKQPTPCGGNIIGWLRELMGGCHLKPKIPNEMLTADVRPGSCWPMKGSKGFAVIRLRQPVLLSSFFFWTLTPYYRLW